jgi:hypothetical protein
MAAKKKRRRKREARAIQTYSELKAHLGHKIKIVESYLTFRRSTELKVQSQGLAVWCDKCRGWIGKMAFEEIAIRRGY